MKLSVIDSPVSVFIRYEFAVSIDGAAQLCALEMGTEKDSVIYPSVNGKWTEDKETTLLDAVLSCLRFLGVPERDRRWVVNKVVKHIRVRNQQTNFKSL